MLYLLVVDGRKVLESLDNVIILLKLLILLLLESVLQLSLNRDHFVFKGIVVFPLSILVSILLLFHRLLLMLLLHLLLLMDALQETLLVHSNSMLSLQLFSVVVKEGFISCHFISDGHQTNFVKS